MRAVDLIIKKREGNILNRRELEFLVNGYVNDTIPDYQVSAFLMAVYFKGMTEAETADLTNLMIASGDRIDLSSLPGIKIDKHSTGGVGDKISLVLAPLAASLGVIVPMMSGRGLGHTGGTLDKLASIPGYRSSLTESEFKAVLATTGYAMIGQSEAMVPADKKLYSLRDVTGTVESIPLITASILSKKFAEGADGFVFDVKCGTGAFMKNADQAGLLARSLVKTGKELNRKVKAVITNMDQPLGMACGNFLEIKEAVLCLNGKGPSDIIELTIRLTAWMLILSGLENDFEKACEKCRQNISNGAAWNKFLENTNAQGGDTSVLLNPDKGPSARYAIDYLAPHDGYAGSIDAYKTGIATVILGAGRAKKEDDVSPGAGILFYKKQGDRILKNECLCTLYSDNEKSFEDALVLIKEAFTVTDTQTLPSSIIINEI